MFKIQSIVWGLFGSFLFVIEANSKADQEAPKVERRPSSWSSGNKQFFGTSFEAYDSKNVYSEKSPTAPLSKVWFTGSHGILNEVYWPLMDAPQVRESQFLVSDGKSFLYSERSLQSDKKSQTKTKVEWLEGGVPAFRVHNSDLQGRFEIEKIIFTDPDTQSVVQRVSFKKNIPGLKLYVLHDPSVSSTPLGNSASTKLSRLTATKLSGISGAGLFAWQEQEAQALLSSVGFQQLSAGFAGFSDGYTDLSDNFKMDLHYTKALQGDVVLTGEVAIDSDVGISRFDFVLSFGNTIESAAQTAQSTLRKNLDSLQKKYMDQWRNYQSGVRNLSQWSTDSGKIFRSSVAMMKAMEDKTFTGGFIASPTIPWGSNVQDWNESVRPGESRLKLFTGYHLVWPRDLYQMATSFLALEDPRSAVASLDYLKRIQYGPKDGEWNFGKTRRRAKEGSFPQNVWVNGEAGWGSVQMDEVAMPVVLVHRMVKQGHVKLENYWDMARRAADFIADFGPWTPQDRWEEHSGFSPAAIAAQVAALRCASMMAGWSGDLARVKRYADLADQWDLGSNKVSSNMKGNLDAWTFTTSGPHGEGRYYQRIEASSAPDQVVDPNDNSLIHLHNNVGTKVEKDIVDGGFLELVRFGVRSPLFPNILSSVKVYDQKIRVDLPKVGPGFYRYLYDGYNYDEQTTLRTKGMLWPFLTGERGHYEIAKALELKQTSEQIDHVAKEYVGSMEKFATPTLMLPEQVWDSGSRQGESTGAATPLGWAHGEYIKLLRSRADQAVFDRPVM